jgi:hypothetical protein
VLLELLDVEVVVVEVEVLEVLDHPGLIVVVVLWEVVVVEVDVVVVLVCAATPVLRNSTLVT